MAVATSNSPADSASRRSASIAAGSTSHRRSVSADDTLRGRPARVGSADADGTRAWIVLDTDDPHVPAELLELALR